MRRIFFCLLFLIIFLAVYCPPVQAMPVGALLYRTSDGGKMYGYNSDDLIVSSKGLIKHIYSGHVAIYVGRENGVDYIVEALGDGVVKNPARYFINEEAGEKYLGAKIPGGASLAQRQTAVDIALELAKNNAGYDLDFKYQKGPRDGQWTCVGLTEKAYESANIYNPSNLDSLEYDPDYYALDITPDGYDNYSQYNQAGDCFSEDKEFSKINRKVNTVLPLPEIIGFNVGLEYQGERYLFLPYTQFLQDSLVSVATDIEISSRFKNEDIRGSVAALPLALKWSLVNNPISSVNKIIAAIWPGKADPQVKSDGLLGQIISEKIDVASVEVAGQEISLTEAVDAVPKIIDKVEKIISPSKKTPVSIKATSSAPKDSSTVQEKNVVAKLDAAPLAPLKTTIKLPKKTTALKASTTPPKVVPAVEKVKQANSSVIVSVANSSSGSTSSNNDSSVAQIPPHDASLVLSPGHLVISRFGGEGDNDWLELYNPYPVELDLAALGYRLEKSKTAANPAIMIRFNEVADGEYRSRTIPAYGRYLIVRESATSSELKSQAQAIARRSEFSWLDDGYTFYLATDSVSTDDDSDIIDKVGFGAATYYEGSGPAPALKDGFYLHRQALASSTLETMLKGGSHENLNSVYDSNDSRNDWLLLPVGGVMPDTSASSTPNDLPTGANFGIDSPGLREVWHLDDCYPSSDHYIVGLFACGRSFHYQYPESFQADLGENFGENFSVGLQYRNLDTSPRLSLLLSNDRPNDSVKLSLEKGLTQIEGLPNISFRSYDHDWFADSDWHSLVLSVDKANSLWSLYQDGETIYQKELNARLGQFKYLTIGGDSGLIGVDEIAVWDRSLPAIEVEAIQAANLPFNPIPALTAPTPLSLANHYSFDEGMEDMAQDSVGANDLEVGPFVWTPDGIVFGSIVQNQGRTTIDGALSPLSDKDLSLSFWWRNLEYPSEARARVSLNHNNKQMFAFIPSYYSPSYVFNGEEYIISRTESIIPNDDAWHFFVLSYSASEYALKLFVDGELKATRYHIWFPNGEAINRLEIIHEGFSYNLDELSIWRGALSPSDITSMWLYPQ